MTTDQAPASPEREALTKAIHVILKSGRFIGGEIAAEELAQVLIAVLPAAQPSADVVGALEWLEMALDWAVFKDNPKVGASNEMRDIRARIAEALAAAREAGPPAAEGWSAGGDFGVGIPGSKGYVPPRATAEPADEGLRLLRELTDAVDGAPEDDYWTDKREPGNKPWNEARAYLAAHPEPEGTAE